MNLTKTAAFWAVAGLVFVACAPHGHIFPLPTMVREGTTPQQFAQDKRECNRASFFGAKERAYYQECMEARGYTRQ